MFEVLTNVRIATHTSLTNEQAGTESFIRKLGAERCRVVKTRDGSKEGPKDANDALKDFHSLR